jgi:hypothetical protein
MKSVAVVIMMTKNAKIISNLNLLSPIGRVSRAKGLLISLTYLYISEDADEHELFEESEAKVKSPSLLVPSIFYD